MSDRVAFALTAVAVALALVVSRLEPWVPTGPPVLDELSTRWETRAAPGATAEVLPDGQVALRVRECEGDCRASVERPVALEGGPWLVTAEFVRGKPGRHAHLFAVTADGQRSHGRQPAVGADRAELVIERPVSGPVTVGARVGGPWGELDVGRVTIVPARRSLLRVLLSGAALLTFAAAAGYAAVWALRALGGAVRIALAGVALAIVGGVLMPARWLDSVLLAIVPGATPADLGGDLLRDPSTPVLVQKFGGHGGGFLLLGAVAALSGASPALALARVAAFALATEAVQVLVPGRSAQPTDLAIDLGAATVGFAAFSLVRGAVRARRPSAASRP